jgi:hypothetical protein
MGVPSLMSATIFMFLVLFTAQQKDNNENSEDLKCYLAMHNSSIPGIKWNQILNFEGNNVIELCRDGYRNIRWDKLRTRDGYRHRSCRAG